VHQSYKPRRVGDAGKATREPMKHHDTMCQMKRVNSHIYAAMLAEYHKVKTCGILDNQAPVPGAVYHSSVVDS
jgi:hypothetical protein